MACNSVCCAHAQVTGGVLVARANSTLVLTCRSQGGRPLPSLSWQSSRHRPLQGNQVTSCRITYHDELTGNEDN